MSPNEPAPSRAPALIEALQQQVLYDHPVRRFELVETHISWVLLTGPYAYKIKKPVDLGFVDFSHLEQRCFYCQEEVRLNRRLAPRLYRGVVRITGSPDHPALNGSGPPIEYAVKMVQFDPEQQFDRRLAAGRLGATDIDRLAAVIAHFHDGVGRATPHQPYGSPAAVYAPVLENFEQIEPLLSAPEEIARLHRLRDWSAAAHEELARLLERRKRAGFIRDCHGDLHLANIALFESDVMPFDCLEFNDRLRWIDIVSEIAFLTMDLDAHRRPDLSIRFLNAYLQHNGDYAGLRLLRYYQVYRAMVRAKVACLRRAQSAAPAPQLHAQFLEYLDLAAAYTRPRRPVLALMHGLSGSGKTTISGALAEQWGAIRIRSDVERKRLFGFAAEDRTASAVGGDLYGPAATARTYQRLAELAHEIVESGLPVLVDATFQKRAERDRFRALARQLGVPFRILHCRAPEARLRRWVAQRAAAATDASEADIAVLEHQIASQEPLTPDEMAAVIAVDTGRTVDIKGLVEQVRSEG